MPYTTVTWAAGELVTSTKLNAMVSNDLLNYKFYGNPVWSAIDAYNQGGSTYDLKRTFALNITPGMVERGELTVICRMYCNNGGTAYFKVEMVEDSLELELDATSSSYITKSGTIDISGITAGIKTIKYYVKSNDTGYTAYVQSVNIIASSES